MTVRVIMNERQKCFMLLHNQLVELSLFQINSKRYVTVWQDTSVYILLKVFKVITCHNLTDRRTDGSSPCVHVVLHV